MNLKKKRLKKFEIVFMNKITKGEQSVFISANNENEAKRKAVFALNELQPETRKQCYVYLAFPINETTIEKLKRMLNIEL